MRNRFLHKRCSDDAGLRRVVPVGWCTFALLVMPLDLVEPLGSVHSGSTAYAAGTVACCFPDGGCADLPLEVCLGEGGDPHDGSCETIECPADPPVGACCIAGGNGGVFCVEFTHEHCAARGGEYLGDGTECTPDACDAPPTVACCFPDGSCFDVPLEVCHNEGGLPHDGSCENTECPGGDLKGCCFPSGECANLPPELCVAEGGVPHDAPCDLIECPGEPPVGACCIAGGNGGVFCEEFTHEHCAARGGEYLGDGTECTPDACDAPPTVACCFPDGSCFDVPLEVCLNEGGLPHDGSCEITECPGGDLKGCCFPSGECANLPAELCVAEGGVPHDAPCDLIECPADPPVGACCIAGGNGGVFCEEFTHEHCAARGGEYLGDGTECAPDACDAPPTVACCFPDGSCFDVPLEVCVNEGGLPHDGSCENTECPGGDLKGCCFENGECANLPAELCLAEGGIPQNAPCELIKCTAVGQGHGAGLWFERFLEHQLQGRSSAAEDERRLQRE